jgi:hypothetical protein
MVVLVLITVLIVIIIIIIIISFNNRTKFTVPTPIKIALLGSILSPAHSKSAS